MTSTHRLPQVPDGPPLPLDERMRPAGFTHGICPECRKDFGHETATKG